MLRRVLLRMASVFEDPAFLAARGVFGLPMPKTGKENKTAAIPSASPPSKRKKGKKGQQQPAPDGVGENPRGRGNSHVVSLQQFAGDGRSLVALDCEMIGVWKDGRPVNALARVSLVDDGGRVLLDEYVKPVLPIHSLRTRYSGIRRHHFQKARPFEEVQQQVVSLLQDKRVVGHALENDFRSLKINPKQLNITAFDTARCATLRACSGLENRLNSLKKLSKLILQRDIQDGAHCSVVDAATSLDLYRFAEQQLKANPDQKLASCAST